MQFGVLGPLEVREGDALLHVRRGRPRSLLHLLLVHRRVVQPPEVIADRLWQDEQPVDAANAVHQLVSYLRRTLGPDGRSLLRTTPVGYCLDVADGDVDVWRFEQLAQDALAGIGSAAADSIARALADSEAALRLWRGEPFAESSAYTWASGEASRLRDVYLQAQESRLEALLALGRHREVVLEAQSLAAAYPLREQLHAHLSLALYRSGRQGEALEVHRSARGLLADELGIDPGPALRSLEDRILRQDSELDWHPPAGAVRTEPLGVDEAATQPLGAGPDTADLPDDQLPPEPASSLVGREQDLGIVASALADRRLVVLTGPGGVGKSRLAVELARTAPGPVWFVTLEDVERDEHVAGTVADRLGLAGRLPHEPVERVAAALAGATGLLVLDACEHVVAAVRELVVGLRAEAPALRVLVTSRRPVGLEGEQVHRLDPLPTPGPGDRDLASLRENPAVRLFEQRARLVRADFTVDEVAAEHVAGIVEDLDGLPIAIELAAAHVDVAGPAAVRARIAGRIDALDPGPPSGPSGRRRSLRAALDASLVLCSEQERRLFAELSVFPGGFDLAAVEAVTGLPAPDAFAGVSSLVRQSLLVSDGGSGYRMLGPLRGYAMERASESGDAWDGLRGRHAAWVAARASAAGGLDRSSGLDQALSDLGVLLPDARSALTWALEADRLDEAAEVAIGFAWVWTMHGLAEEGIGWLSQVKERCDAAPHDRAQDKGVRATVLRCLGMLANPLGRLEASAEACKESVMLYEEAEDRLGLAAALMTLGVAEWALGRLEHAAATHDRALALLGDRPWTWQYMSALTLRARTALDAGEHDAAARIDAAVEAAQEGAQEQMLGLALACRARYLLLEGDLGSAALTAEAARGVWRSIGYREGEMSALNLVGRVRLGRGEVVEAETCFHAALTLARMTHHRGAACESVESLAMAAAASGRREHAYLLLMVARRERRRISAPVPGADRPSLAALEGRLRDGLGEAVPLVETRAVLERFDDLLDRLLEGAGAGDGAVDVTHTMPSLV